MHKPTSILLAMISAITLALTGCGVNPVTGKKEMQLVSEQKEIEIGQQYYSYLIQAEGGEYTVDPGVNRYVADVGKKLAVVSDRPKLPYEFTVIDNNIPKAWALPGGKIAINIGLPIK